MKLSDLDGDLEVGSGLGQVSLCDMPVFILQHDSAHKAEIEARLTQFNS